MTDFTGAPDPPDLSVSWLHGRPRGGGVDGPPLQIHHVDANTVMLRQSKTLTYEAPFLYLLFGDEAALLLDTGAVKDASRMPLRETVDELVADWLQMNPRSDYHLIVAHTHGHADHIDGDSQFVERANTTVVGTDLESVMRFFAITRWPEQLVELDLGGRVLTVTGCPGHHDASIAIYDPWTQFLLTGDTVYPGRLYVNDVQAFVGSLDRLVALAEQHPVSWVMGCHIEMTRTPRVDYPVGTRYQPEEPRLQMTVEQLRQVREAGHAVKDQAGVHVFDDFIIFNGRCFGGMLKQLLRANGSRVRALIARS